VPSSDEPVVSLRPYVHVDARIEAAPAGTRVALSAGERHHLTRVLRLGPGAEVVVADGAGSHGPAELDGDALVLSAPAVTEPRPRPALEVAQALGKARKLDEVVRAVTELGADRILPVTTARTVVRLEGERADKAQVRWRSVARAACEQARRPYRPRIDALVPLEHAATDGATVLVAHPGARPLPDHLAALAAAAAVRIVIGPEGGWTDGELAALVADGATAVGLGPTVLRTEHAAAAALAVIGAAVGRWNGR
jgi:16S rRNA (uracil1498-N3)-methyltransferase